MYLVAHQDDCQMVVGNVLKVRKPGTAEPGAVWSVDGTDYDARLPRQCTCEPELAPYHVYVRCISTALANALRQHRCRLQLA